MPGARAFTFVGVASAAAALRSAGAATRIAGAKPTVAERQWRAMTELYLPRARGSPRGLFSDGCRSVEASRVLRLRSLQARSFR